MKKCSHNVKKSGFYNKRNFSNSADNRNHKKLVVLVILHTMWLTQEKMIAKLSYNHGVGMVVRSGVIEVAYYRFLCWFSDLGLVQNISTQGVNAAQ